MIPTFEYRIAGDTLSYRWANVVPGLRHAARRHARLADDCTLIRPTEAWQTAKLATPADFKVDVNFYVNPKRVE